MPAKTGASAVEVHERPRGIGGRAGNKGGPGRPDLAYRERARYWEEQSKGLEVLARIVSGDILEFLGEKQGELVVGYTANSDRIAAYRELRDSAGFGPPRAAAEAPDQPTVFVIVLPPKAKTAEQWLKAHKQGAA